MHTNLDLEKQCCTSFDSFNSSRAVTHDSCCLAVKNRTITTDADFEKEHIQTLLEKTRTEGLGLDNAALEYAYRKTLEGIAEALSSHPEVMSRLQGLTEAVEILDLLPFQVNLWKVQNIYYDMLQSVYPYMQGRAGQGNSEASEWVEKFCALAEKLSVRIP